MSDWVLFGGLFIAVVCFVLGYFIHDSLNRRLVPSQIKTSPLNTPIVIERDTIVNSSLVKTTESSCVDNKNSDNELKANNAVEPKTIIPIKTTPFFNIQSIPQFCLNMIQKCRNLTEKIILDKIRQLYRIQK